ALDWSDIDFKDKTVSISKNKTQFGIGLPKNKKTRVIPLINKLAEYLAPIKKDKGLIFDTYYLAINRQMRALCERLGFFFEGLHNTRHTFASLMLQAKENPLLVVRFLGHADMTMLNKVYAHYLEDTDDCNRFSTLLTHTA
ncbi:MAG TPA: tyrosine-type recombinase/integrase, partial [Campylobacterales bacterium]|nr:tyrosine-type recombinase/integrase [Campylobacterales bacterium]